MKRIFISGALNSNSVGFLKNVRKMNQVTGAVRKLGVRYYNPIDDLLTSLICGCEEHQSFLEWDLMELEYCDALLLVPGYENSPGVKGEREKAKSLGLPEFKCICELKKWLELND